MTETQRKPSLLEAFIPIIFLIALLGLNVYYFGDSTLDGSNQIALILASGIAAIVALRLGYKWNQMLDGIVHSISSAMSSILILLLIGALAGTWLLSGIVPAMIYYGLNILNPTIFLVAACIVSAIVSVATGSSWSTIATLGVALLGIGQTLGLGTGVVAGAIISGAYFGDKMSPLSDTTNLAPAMAGTDLFTHIRYMAITTVPTFVITLIIFLIWGFLNNSEADLNQVALVQEAILEKFNITYWLFLVPVLVIAMIVKKISAIPALLIGSLLGGVFAIIFQPEIIEVVAGASANFFESSYKAVMYAMYGDISIATNNEMVNGLLSTGGMYGMLNTIWLIICAMVFGGVMESTNMLRTITASIIKLANSTGSLVASTAGTCVFFNITASDQYLAIVVPGRMFADIYAERGLKPEVLSRTLEDSGTVTSVLIPWNTCGATQSSVLGVSTWTYAPYCFFNIISPFMTILFAYLNFKIRRISDK
jgi:NhaC family Na+:H+ antiporter